MPTTNPLTAARRRHATALNARDALTRALIVIHLQRLAADQGRPQAGGEVAVLTRFSSFDSPGGDGLAGVKVRL